MTRSEIERITRQSAQTAYLGDGVALARVLTRYKMLLHTSDRGFAGNVMLDGYWEIWLTQFFARNLKPGMRTIDIGANYGYYTLLFSDIVTHTGRVLAAEPNPAAADLLRQSVRLNGFANRVTVIEAALGAEADSSGTLFVPDGEPKNAHIGASQEAGRVHTVKLTSVDCLAAGMDRVDMVKIDAEGGEMSIIAGMRDLLNTRPPALVLEFNTDRGADPAGFLAGLIQIYGSVSAIGYDGEPAEVTAETVLTTRFGEDWMLWFAAPGS
jgi:FkbM family methyltransferase